MAANTRGWFNDYATKCILDVGCNCSINATKDSQVYDCLPLLGLGV